MKALPWAALYAAACLALSVSFPRTLPQREERYACIWADGSEEELSYPEAFNCLAGIGERGEILFEREGMRGHLSPDPVLEVACTVFAAGSLLDLLTLQTEGLSPIASAALYREAAGTVWYAGEAFRFDGRTVGRADPSHAEEVVLIDGGLPTDYLREMGTERLVLKEWAEIEANDLCGSYVKEVAAEAPYRADGDGVYLDTPGGRRFLAALPLLTSFRMEDCAFADAGALSPCGHLKRLDLAFVGSSATGLQSDFDGSLLSAFATKNVDTMPASLVYVKVRGGMLTGYAFYGGHSIEEVDACGVKAENISEQAFLGMENLKTLHSPRADVLLPGEFTSRTAPCGCTIFERKM